MLVALSTSAAPVASSPAVVAAGQQIPPHHHPQPGGDKRWNLSGADIHAVINTVSHITGKNFIVDPRVSGKVSFTTGRGLSRAEVYPVFLSMLQVLGYTAVPGAHAIKIVPSTEQRFAAGPVQGRNHTADDATAVRVFTLRHVDAQQLQITLRPLLPDSASLTAYAPANVLVIAASGLNLTRLAQIIAKVDVPSSNQIDIIPLQHALAGDVVQSIKALSSDPMGGINHLRLAIDNRSNSVLLGGSLAQRLPMRLLIAELDTPNRSGGEGNTEVIYLHYLNVKNVVPVLANVAKASYGDQVGSYLQPRKSLTPLDSALDDLSHTASDSTSQNVLKTKVTPAPASDTLASARVDSGSKQVEIVGEPNTNALIITAPPLLMRTLKTVIRQIDIRPAQVLIEAAIVEISEAQLQSLGVKWGTPSSGDVNDGTTFSQLNGGLGIGFIKGRNFRIMLEALANDTHSNILATPSLVVLDNQKAGIKVGEVAPFTRSSYATSAGDPIANPYVDFEREFVGLSLNVIPQINQGDAVMLQISQGNESILNETASPSSSANFNPRTSKSAIDTSVLVNDKEILVLGGLIQEQAGSETVKLPILGDIPVLGRLFRTNNDNHSRKNLMVFLQPTIIHSAEQGVLLTQQKYQHIQDQQLLYQLKHHQGRLLPPFGDAPGVALPAPFA